MRKNLTDMNINEGIQRFSSDHMAENTDAQDEDATGGEDGEEEDQIIYRHQSGEIQQLSELISNSDHESVPQDCD